MKRQLNVNGKIYEAKVSDDTPLLWVLRDHFGLTGTKYGCGVMACGACTVLVDGKATRSCLTPVSSFNADQKITTIESQSTKIKQAIEKAWTKNSVAQCGYCQPGMVMSAVALLQEIPNPNDAQINERMTNICRCGTYQLIRTAVKEAAQEISHG